MKAVSTAKIVEITAAASALIAIVALVAFPISEEPAAGLFIIASIGVMEATKGSE